MIALRNLCWLVLPILASCAGVVPNDDATTEGQNALKKKPICNVESDPASCSGSGSHKAHAVEHAYVDASSATFTDANLYFSTPAGPRLVHVVVGKIGDAPDPYVPGSYTFETDVPGNTAIDQVVALHGLSGWCFPYWFGLYVDGALQASGNFTTACPACPEEQNACVGHCDPGFTLNAGRNVCVPCGAAGQLGCGPGKECHTGLVRAGSRCMRADAKQMPELVLLCNYNETPSKTAEPLARKLFELSGSGTDNIVDYYAEMSYGHMDLSGSKVAGWYTMGSITNPAIDPTKVGRTALRNACVAAAQNAAPSLNFSAYYKTIAVVNVNNADDGADGALEVTIAQDHLDTNFMTHEMGHGYGLLHTQDELLSSCGGAAGDYCDPWDEMSAQNNYSHPVSGFPDRDGQPGASGFVSGSRLMLGKSLGLDLFSPSEVAVAATGTSVITLTALNRNELTGVRVVKIPISEGVYYTVELVRNTGWDIGAPTDRVLVHRVNESAKRAAIVLSGSMDKGWAAGTTCTRTGMVVKVLSIDAKTSTAVVKVTRGG